MPCIPLLSANKRRRIGFVCGFHPEYEFDGYLFEIHRYFGPIPLRRDTHSPRVSIPKGFWEMWDKFSLLPDAEREKYRVD